MRFQPFLALPLLLSILSPTISIPINLNTLEIESSSILEKRTTLPNFTIPLPKISFPNPLALLKRAINFDYPPYTLVAVSGHGPYRHTTTITVSFTKIVYKPRRTSTVPGKPRPRPTCSGATISTVTRVWTTRVTVVKQPATRTVYRDRVVTMTTVVVRERTKVVEPRPVTKTVTVTVVGSAAARPVDATSASVAAPVPVEVAEASALQGL